MSLILTAGHTENIPARNSPSPTGTCTNARLRDVVIME